ncbi:MAG: hypothetical protein U0236_07380 [Nitrospira sp.]
MGYPINGTTRPKGKGTYRWSIRTKGEAMWFLLLLLLASPPGFNSVTVLNTFATHTDCQTERNRIGFEMAESYPHDNDFRIACEFRENKPAAIPDRQARQEQALLDRSSDTPLFS